MMKYILVEWPDCQYYMDHPRRNECYYGTSADNDFSNVWFVPEDIYEEVETSKLYPSEFDLPIGHIKITMDEVELNGEVFTRDESKLKKGSKVIMYCPEKGYWVTNCVSYVDGFPPIFEDSCTLLESEIVGIKNDIE